MSVSVRSQRGFTLLEVVVALAILAISLGVLMESQVTSLAAAGRARDMTIATLLARSKMIDLERELFDEGFTSGDQEEDGDFNEEGHPEIKWKSKVMEVELDLATLGGTGDSKDGSKKEDKSESSSSMSADGFLSGLGGSVEGIVKGLSDNMRVVDLAVSWPRGKYSESMHVRAVVTKDDLGTSPNAGALPGSTGTETDMGAPGGRKSTTSSESGPK